MKKDVCVIIPVYKEMLSHEEEVATLNNCDCLRGVDIFFIAPDKLNITYYQCIFPQITVIRFPTRFFKSTETYSKLMLSIHFYKRFIVYRYMLICQTDVWILRQANTLNKFVKLGYDYIGAPWFPSMRIQFPDKDRANWYIKEYELHVGNGGLSLRNIKKTINILRKFFLLKIVWKKNEDLFFSFIGEVLDKNFRISPIHVAKKFSLEMNSREIIKKKGIIPLGVHAYDKFYAELPYEKEFHDE